MALATVRYIDEGGDSHSSGMFGDRDLEMPKKDVNNILKTISGMQHPIDEDLAKSVWKKAADDGESIGPHGSGMNADFRAFFYYLLRGNFPSNEWEDLDLVKLVEEFGNIPRIYRAPDNAAAREKDECLRLAYGDKRHEELNAMLRS